MKQPLCRDQRSQCPIASALDIVGDKWTLLVIRDLFLGKARFDEFLASPEGIATNILAQRLRWLRENDLVLRAPDPDDGRKVIYSLTERGRSLIGILTAVRKWGLASIENTNTPPEIAAILARQMKEEASGTFPQKKDP